jgi:hypothetical protein
MAGHPRPAAIDLFDEPTTSLTTRETARLFDLIGRLRDSGKSMIYVSHALGDVPWCLPLLSSWPSSSTYRVVEWVLDPEIGRTTSEERSAAGIANHLAPPNRNLGGAP